MPILKSPAKRMRSDAKKAEQNQTVQSEIKNLYKKMAVLVKDNSKEVPKVARALVGRLDSAVRKGVIKKNTANRKKSRIAILVSKKTSKK
jgi:small subunit ribosomal protein S20